MHVGTCTWDSYARTGQARLHVHVACRYMYMYMGQLHACTQGQGRPGWSSQEAYQLESVAALIVVRIE